ncbi:uncharacterized protein LOC120444966 [Drosophila santomea]|uniref:uncharacterized protein LOC120444966 n=1 Tax=Drosophila santomea TaxID=129105 RepID=UPI0019536E53|nr:uncharacterized protein LOC120444966 [Drosophila santomea]
MNTTFKVARMSLNHSWRLVSNKAKGEFSSLRRLPAVSGQKRRYADRYTFDDHTQAQIQGIKKMKEMADVPQESPWRDSEWTPDFPERLDEMGYESHCNDRLYIAKNKFRHSQQKYELEREERRKEAQKRISSHFSGSHGQAEPDTMRRRTISQDPVDHQRRQEAIIEQNRRRWQNRPESRRETNSSGITYRPDTRKEQYVEEKLQRESEDYQRMRRNPEKSEEAKDSQTVVYDANRPSAEWLRKRQEENEAEYWHSWQTCPCSRESETTEEVKPHLKRKKVVAIPPAYPRDYQRRGYHQISPPAYSLKAKTVVLMPKRRPSGIDKQYHKFARKQAALWQQDFLEPEDNAQPGLLPKKEEKKKPKRKEERRSVEPPRFRMVVKTRAPANRPSTPVFSYSGQVDIPPTIAGPTAYMGSLRKSAGETWRKFSSASSS